MVPRPFAAARAMRSRTCADVIQPCCGPPSCTASFPGSSLALLRSSHMTSWQPHRCLGTGRCWEYFCMAAGHVRKHSQWPCEVPATTPCNKVMRKRVTFLCRGKLEKIKQKERNRLPAHVTNVGMPMVKYPQRRISSSIAALSFAGFKNYENDWKKN